MYVPHDLEVGYKTLCSSLLLLDNVSSFSSRSPKPLIIINHLPLFLAVVIDWHLGHILSHWDFYFLAHHLYPQHCFWWSWHSLTWSTQPLAFMGFQVAQWVKNLPAMQEMQANVGLIPRLGRFPEGRHGNPLHCSCLENPTDRGASWATVHRAAKSRTQLKWLSTPLHLTSTDLFPNPTTITSPEQYALLEIKSESWMWVICAILNVKVTTLKKWKGTGEINFSGLFYLTQYIQNIIVSTNDKHKILMIF